MMAVRLRATIDYCVAPNDDIYKHIMDMLMRPQCLVLVQSLNAHEQATYANQSLLSHRDAVDAERTDNKAIGDTTGCWKAGVLVEDDAGSVRKALNELARSRPKLKSKS